MVYLVVKKRVVGFELTLANTPGTLNKITSVTKDHNLNIYYIETYSKSTDKYELFIAIDFNDTKVSPEEILKEFRKYRKYVLEASIAPIFKNIIYPSKFYTKDIGNIRAILFDVANMKGLIEKTREKIGVEAGNALLYYLGDGVGKEIYEIYGSSLGIKDFEEGILLLKTLARGAGWAEIIEYEKKDDKIILKLEKLWECEIQKNTVDKPASHFVRGLLAGFFKTLLEKEVIVKEVKCIAVGNPYCQFEISVIS